MFKINAEILESSYFRNIETIIINVNVYLSVSWLSESIMTKLEKEIVEDFKHLFI